MRRPDERNKNKTAAHPSRWWGDYDLGIFEPSVAQPPLPLQLFLPLQPLSPLLQPPLPLQEFWPLQACFSAFLLVSCLSGWCGQRRFRVGKRPSLYSGACACEQAGNRCASDESLGGHCHGWFSLQLKFQTQSPFGQSPARKTGRNLGREGRRSSGGSRSPSRLANPKKPKSDCPSVTPGVRQGYTRGLKKRRKF